MQINEKFIKLLSLSYSCIANYDCKINQNSFAIEIKEIHFNCV